MSETREAQVVETFLAMTDTLVHDFDAADMLTMLAERCTQLLDVSAAGIILADGQGQLSVAAASSKRSQLLEVFAVAIDGGPCVDCVRTGALVLCDDLTTPDAQRRWARYSAGAAEAGFRATHALPMRLRDEVVGVLTLLHTGPHTLSDEDARLGQALADAATIGLVHERAVRRAETVQEQLQGALNSRILVEQAKGVLATYSHVGPHATIGPDEAFVLLRSHARSHGQRITDLARGLVDHSVDPTTILGTKP